jgi:6,7-dimethyl-8-ribityllumazine synthase
MANTSTGSGKLLKKQKGTRQLAGAFVVLIKTEWNSPIVDELEKGCLAELTKNGIKKTVTIIVPGAVEIPFGIKTYWDHSGKKKRPDAFIALGCVIKGDTPHFDYVCKAVTDGIVQLNVSLPIPTIFGVLTVNNEEQARERIGGKHGHKGEEAAITALKMIGLVRSLKK